MFPYNILMMKSLVIEMYELSQYDDRFAIFFYK